MQPLSMASLELSVSGLGSPVALGPTLDLDALDGSSPFQLSAPLSEMEHLWVKRRPAAGRCSTSARTYDNIFASSLFRGPDVHVEGSRDSSLIDAFMDLSKWTEFFPIMVTRARTIDVLANGMAGRSESSVRSSGSFSYSFLQLTTLHLHVEGLGKLRDHGGRQYGAHAAQVPAPKPLHLHGSEGVEDVVHDDHGAARRGELPEERGERGGRAGDVGLTHGHDVGGGRRGGVRVGRRCTDRIFGIFGAWLSGSPTAVKEVRHSIEHLPELCYVL